MTRGANAGPAVMLMPPHIKAAFMPNPPLKHYPPQKKRRKHAIEGVSNYLVRMEKTQPPKRDIMPTPQSLKERRKELKREAYLKGMEPIIAAYRKAQKESSGEFEGINCYNTLFVGRLAYEVTERKLLREMETFGPVKDIKIIKDKEGNSRGYAFVEYENEEDMKRAYRAADAMRIEGREIVVDVERGHTVPNWLPRRLGGGLGGTRLGGPAENVNRPGRFDPSRPELPPAVDHGPGIGRGIPQGPPPQTTYGGGGRGRGYHDNPPPHYGMGRSGDRLGSGPPPPPRDYDRGGYSGDHTRKRYRSRSPDRGPRARRRY